MMRFIMAAPDEAAITSAATCGSSSRLIREMVCGMMASSDVMAITKWSIQAPSSKKSLAFGERAKTISNVLAEERPLLSTRSRSRWLAQAVLARGSLFDEGQRPGHGFRCGH